MVRAVVDSGLSTVTVMAPGAIGSATAMVAKSRSEIVAGFQYRACIPSLPIDFASSLLARPREGRTLLLLLRALNYDSAGVISCVHVMARRSGLPKLQCVRAFYGTIDSISGKR
jgi:hypothetical protein